MRWSAKLSLGVWILLVGIFAFWGVVEFFHEGWFYPYIHFVFYLLPCGVLVLLGIVVLRNRIFGGLLIVLCSLGFSVWRAVRLAQLHYPVPLSLWIVGFVLALPGVGFIIDGIKNRDFTFNKRWLFAILVVPMVIIVGIGVPTLVHHLGRVELEDFGERVVMVDGVEYVLAGDGPGWFYSNKHPIVFGGKSYTGLSWNEIALFGMSPIGFDGKRYGPWYDGTEESIYYATQEDFDRYNMFRYLNYDGTALTDSVQDYWRLPTVEEYVKLMCRRGESAGGYVDSLGIPHYKIAPDKDAPLWACDEEVIYYWTSTSADSKYAYDISYSGRVRRVLKTSVQDYRGFRAVRTVPLNR